MKDPQKHNESDSLQLEMGEEMHTICPDQPGVLKQKLPHLWSSISTTFSLLIHEAATSLVLLFSTISFPRHHVFHLRPGLKVLPDRRAIPGGFHASYSSPSSSQSFVLLSYHLPILSDPSSSKIFPTATGLASGHCPSQPLQR